MKIIGLTGGIATGKSTVSEMLKGLGVAVIDSDQIAREVVKQGRPALEEIAMEFGADILNQDGSLNRKALADIVFNNQLARKKLETITHPRIIKKIKELLADYRGQGEKMTVIDAPLLIETGMQTMTDEVWLVTCTDEQQYARLQQRSLMEHNQAKKRIEAQMSLTEKAKYADVIIDNSGSIDQLRQKVIEHWQQALLK